MGTASYVQRCGCSLTTSMGHVGDGETVAVQFCPTHYAEDPAGCDAKIAAAAVAGAAYDRAMQALWACERQKPGRHV